MLMDEKRTTLIEARGLKIYFPVSDGLSRRDRRVVHAVDGVDLTLAPGEVLAVVGESGCGKTTIARAIVGLVKPTAGSIKFKGKELKDLSTKELKRYRQQVQMIFQDPFDSMNPRKTAFQMIAQALTINKIVPKSELRAEVIRLLKIVGLAPPEAYLKRYRYQLSGGERQRLSVARALSVKPEIIVADEPVSSLDISIRGQILSLLRELHEDSQLAYVFISHDLSVVRSLADRIMIVYLGQVVEEGSTEEVFTAPRHPYTRALLAAQPIPNPVISRQRARIVLTGDVPSPIEPPAGCRFHTRCPIAEAICEEEPPLFMAFEEGHRAACHFGDRVDQKLAELEAGGPAR